MNQSYKEWLEELMNSDIDSVEFDHYIAERYPWMRVRVDEYCGYWDESSGYLTHWGDIPLGWRRAFGQEWLDDIDKIYCKLSLEEQKDFFPVQLKEKFGSFRQYWSTYYEELDDVLEKYEALSTTYCIVCGAPATAWTTGWIMPVCKQCADDNNWNIEEITK